MNVGHLKPARHEYAGPVSVAIGSLSMEKHDTYRVLAVLPSVGMRAKSCRSRSA